jgi:hypothetical protein
MPRCSRLDNLRNKSCRIFYRFIKTGTLNTHPCIMNKVFGSGRVPSRESGFRLKPGAGADKGSDQFTEVQPVHSHAQ